jgi:hypothetical protein
MAGFLMLREYSLPPTVAWRSGSTLRSVFALAQTLTPSSLYRRPGFPKTFPSITWVRLELPGVG